MSRCISTASLLLLLSAFVGTAGATGRETQEADRVQAVVDKVRELRQAEEALLSDLDPEQRAEVERRLAADAATPSAPPSTATTPATDLTSPRALRPSPSRCNTLLLFDSNGDGRFSGADRHWRHFSVWWQGDPAGLPESKQLEALLAAGVREIALDLRSWQDRRGNSSDIRLDGAVRLLQRQRRDEREGLLVLDATSLREAEGPLLVAADGTPLEGLQPLRPGLGLRVESGELYPFDCP